MSSFPSNEPQPTVEWQKKGPGGWGQVGSSEPKKAQASAIKKLKKEMGMA